MRVERQKNFLTPAECEALNAWADEGVAKRYLDIGITNYTDVTTRRVTSRMYGHRYIYPKFVLDISQRVREFCGVAAYPLIEGHGRDGVVVSCTFPGGDVYEHKDPVCGDLATLRCNVMTRRADAGGRLHIEGEHFDIEVGELHCYLVSEHKHYVTPVEGGTPRVLWMFGAGVPAVAWDNGEIKFGVS